MAEKYGIVLPTTRVVRAVVEVKATYLPPDKKQAIARTLSHSDQTAEEHYRALERNKSMLGYQSVGEILGDPVVKGEPTSGASPPPPPPPLPSKGAIHKRRSLSSERSFRPSLREKRSSWTSKQHGLSGIPSGGISGPERARYLRQGTEPNWPEKTQVVCKGQGPYYD